MILGLAKYFQILLNESMQEDTPEHDIRNLHTSPPESDTDTNHTFHAPTTGIYNDPPKGSSKLVMLILAVVILAVIGASAYFLRGKFTGSAEPSPSPLEEVSITESTPAPTPSGLDRSKFTLRVLNGTGTAGLAASVSAKLKDLGYQIERTGNATNSAFTKTIVRGKTDSTDLIAQLIKDLAPEYDASQGASLRASDASDAEVIIGEE